METMFVASCRHLFGLVAETCGHAGSLCLSKSEESVFRIHVCRRVAPLIDFKEPPAERATPSAVKAKSVILFFSPVRTQNPRAVPKYKQHIDHQACQSTMPLVQIGIDIY